MNGPDVEQLTLFQEDSRANLFPWQETRKGKTTSVIYGRRCYELSENLRRVGSSVRTYLESCTLPLPTLLRTWSVSAITSRCLILKLRLSARDTDENECSLLENALWKTPVATDGSNREFYRNSRGEPNLSAQVKIAPTGPAPKCEKMWPTPTTQETEHPEAEITETGRRATKDGSDSHSLGLADAVKLWSTPTAGMHKNSNYDLELVKERAKKHQIDLAMECVISENGGALNPTWVEWLMGFPLGWTDLNASEMP